MTDPERPADGATLDHSGSANDHSPGHARNIILLSDGTGNSASSLFKTNVRRVYDALDLTDPADPILPRQFAYYDDGVGTSGFRPLAILGGAFGWGLKRNVLDLYTFLCRTWRPGDRIYGFGFSRGAFTIRVVNGLIMHQGIIPYDGDEAKLQRNARAAYRAYRRARYSNLNPLIPLGRAARDVLAGAWNRLWHRDSYNLADNRGRPEASANGRGARTAPDQLPSHDRPVEVEMLGLWDTVDAYGLPIEELTRAVDLVLWPLTMPDGDLDPRVQRACHALCLDDERRTFHPRLWNEQPRRTAAGSWGGVEGGNTGTRHIREERISQVWFAGVHADVGGGYADDSLSYVSLGWMIREAESRKLRFSAPTRDRMLALADENGPIHDSRRGLASYYRYQPRDVGRLSAGRAPPWFRFTGWLRSKLRRDRLVHVPRPKIHESVFRRVRVGQDGYAPISLPGAFAVARLNGDIVDGEAFLASEDTGAPGSPASPAPRAKLPGLYAHREYAWNWVWRRRVVYFVTLFTTLGLFAMPLYLGAEADAACLDGGFCILSPPIALLAALLPGTASFWVASFTSHPLAFLSFVVAIGLLVMRGRALDRRVGDEMRRAWFAVPGLAPRTGVPPVAPKRPGPLNRAVEWLRTRRLYLLAWRAMAGYVLPVAAMLVAAYLGLAAVNHVAYASREAWFELCASPSMPVPVVVGEVQAARPILTREPCNATGLQLEAGATYALRITIPSEPVEIWRDASLPAGPNGIRSDDLPGVMGVFVPMRRHLAHNWFRLMARVGAGGNDTYALHWNLVSPDGQPQTYQAKLTARGDGELFLYVNDAGIVVDASAFYTNNHGSAVLQVRRLSRRYPPAASPGIDRRGPARPPV